MRALCALFFAALSAASDDEAHDCQRTGQPYNGQEDTMDEVTLDPMQAPHEGPEDLARIDGVTPRAAAVVSAAVVLGRRNADAPHPGQAAARRPKTPSPQDMIPRPHRLQRHDLLKCRDLEWATSTGHRTARAANPQPEQQSRIRPMSHTRTGQPTRPTTIDTDDGTRLEQPRAPLTTDDEYGPASRPESSPPRHATTASPDPGGSRRFEGPFGA